MRFFNTFSSVPNLSARGLALGLCAGMALTALWTPIHAADDWPSTSVRGGATSSSTDTPKEVVAPKTQRPVEPASEPLHAPSHVAEPARPPKPLIAPITPIPAITPAKPATTAAKPAAAPSMTAKEIGDQVRAALQGKDAARNNLPLVVDGKEKKIVPGPVEPRLVLPRAAAASSDAQFQRARAKALGLPVTPAPKKETTDLLHVGPWSYEGNTGPQFWSKLNPDYQLCANGHRQSPIAIEEGQTLLGPAEPIRFSYQPSQGVVVHNGHTIEIDVTGNNTFAVRDTVFRLEQFHFHHPAEEIIKKRSYPLVAHLVHRSADGQIAVVAILFDIGVPSPLIDKVLTYLPLDAYDRVRMPPDLVDLNELLPKDPRYYQFIGSLTTPPCSEGVLWLIMKQPMTLSHAQLRVFEQLFPNNARPVQPTHERPVREAQ